MAKKKQQSKIKKITKKTNPLSSNIGIWGLVIALLGIILYANTFGHDFALDDFSAIKENYVTKQGFAGISTIWQEHYRFGYWNSPGEMYRPMSLMMFAMEWGIAPDSPFLHHLVNVLVYGLTGFLLFLALIKIFSGQWLLAFLGSAKDCMRRFNSSSIT